MNVERLDPDRYGTPEAWVEWCGRLSHGPGSQDRAGADTVAFLRRVVLQAGHQSLLEHATIRARVPRALATDAALLRILQHNNTVAWTWGQDDTVVLGLNGRHLFELQRASRDPLVRALATAAYSLFPTVLQADRCEDAVGIELEQGHALPDADVTEDPATVMWASFLVEDVSRVTEAQFCRHRTLSFTVQSGRHVLADVPRFVWPPTVPDESWPPDDSGLTGSTRPLVEANMWHEYGKLRAAGVPQQDARYFLPQGSMTRFVVTGSLRAWRHFLELRTAPDAQWEIRAVALEIRRSLGGQT